MLRLIPYMLKAFVNFKSWEIRQEVKLLEGRETTILLPAPIITEVLVEDPSFVKDSGISKEPLFRIAPLDLLACDLAAKITRKLKSLPAYKDTQRMTIGIQIVSIAAANNCYMIYSECSEIGNIVKSGGLDIAVCTEKDLPIFDPTEYSYRQ